MSNNKQDRKQTVGDLCLTACRRILSQFQQIKEAIRAEFTKRFGVDEHLVRLALNEAEAQAFETGYPQLVFPLLAQEKAHEVLRWQRHQDVVRRRSTPSLSLSV
jgi:hypothetical protein